MSDVLQWLGLKEVETVGIRIDCGDKRLPAVTGAMRPRAYVNGRRADVYVPKRHKEACEAISDRWRADRGTRHAGYTGPVAVTICSHRRAPQSWPQRRDGEQDTAKPDVDNVAKLVLDALTGIAFADDAQVVLLEAVKAPRTGERDYYEIEVAYLTPIAARML